MAEGSGTTRRMSRFAIELDENPIFRAGDPAEGHGISPILAWANHTVEGAEMQ